MNFVKNILEKIFGDPSEKELERIKKEKEEDLDIYGEFGKEKPAGDIDDPKE